MGSYLRTFPKPSVKVPIEKLWYLPAEHHILELAFFTLFYGIWFLVLLKFGKDRNGKTELKRDEKNNLPQFAKLLRIILTVCILITVRHKFYGEKLALMFMPCHFVTACYLYALWHPSKFQANAAFNISIHYQFFTWLALLLPDHTGLTQNGEILNFWIHHWILCIIPLFLIFTRHFELDKKSHYYFQLAICLCGLVHYDIMLVAALLTGHNVSYMLFPPPKSPINGPFFRVGHQLFLIFMGWVGGYLVPRVVISFSAWMRFPYYLESARKKVE